jgi:four helix bundle protein
MSPDDLADRLIEFAARVGKVVDALPDTRLARHIAGQLIRCGTSPAPNCEEACAAERRADFVHKLQIALKELRESRSWIRLIIKTELLPEHRMVELLEECCQLANILGQSVVTAKANRARQYPLPICNLHFEICILQWRSDGLAPDRAAFCNFQ